MALPREQQTFKQKINDYSGQRIPAMRLLARIRAYWWDNYKLSPVLRLVEELGPDGKNLYSVKSNLVIDFKTNRMYTKPFKE